MTHPDFDPRHDVDGELTIAEEGPVRVFYIAAPTVQDLTSRVALVLGEHMRDDDELHITYNAMQAGWTDHQPKKGNVIRPPQQGWTELHFEYSAMVVLRERAKPHSRRSPSDADTAGDDLAS
jgi:hypothetical protein